MLHPNFDNDYVKKYQNAVKLVKAFYDGFDTAKDYIEQYVEEDENAFATRKKLSSLTNYTKEAVHTVRNMIFRKPTDLSGLDNTALEYVKNSAEEFLRDLAVSVVRDGHAYILVEKLPYNDVATRADELGLLPYLVKIDRSSVRNFKYRDGRLVQFTYDEVYTVEDGYATIDKVQQRVYLEGGRVEIWRDDTLYEVYESGLDYIPIVKIGDDDIPPFYDLAILNRTHLNLQSEQRNYVRMCANPIGVANMLNTDGKLKIGANTWLNFDAPKTEAGFGWAELSGRNNEVIEKLLDRREADMRRYIAAITDGARNRTATEVELLNAGNESLLNDFATKLEDGFNKALQIMADYQGLQSFAGRILINRDYTSDKLTDNQIREYKDLYIQGVISWRVLIDALIDGEVIKPMTDDEIATMKEELILNG